MNRHISVILLTLMIFTLAGCATTSRVNYDKKSNFSFDGLKSYFVLQSSKTKEDGQDNFLTLDDTRAINAIKTSLNQKGYQQVSKDKADFIISFQIVNDKKYRSNSFYSPWGFYPFGYGYHGGYGNNYIREYQVGSLIIDLIDPKLKQVIWRGSTSSRIKANLTPVEKASRIQAAVTQILSVLP